MSENKQGERLTVPAQGSRQCYLYLMSEPFGLFKIGIAGNVERRLITLQASTPYKLTIVAKIKVDDPIMIESFIHSLLSKYHVRGEWFRLPEGQKTWADAIRRFRRALKAPPKLPLLLSPPAELMAKYNPEIQDKLTKKARADKQKVQIVH